MFTADINSDILLYLCIIASVCFCTIMYFVFAIRAKTKIKRSILQMTRLAQSLLNDTFEKPLDNPIVLPNESLSDFYAIIEDVRENLHSKERSRADVLDLINSVAVNIEFDKLLSDILPKLMDFTGSIGCAFYITNVATNKLEIKHSYGFGNNLYSEFDIALGEGFLGMAANSNEIKVIKDLPDDTIYLVKTFLGKIKPKSLLIVPILSTEKQLGIMVFASVRNYSDTLVSTINLIRHYIGFALDNSLTYEKTKRLTVELKFQNRLIQNLIDELEKKIQDRILYMNNLINSIKDYAIYSMDKNGTIMYWNTGAELLLGYKASEVVGKNIDIIYPEEDVNSGKIQSRIDATFKNGSYVENGWRTKKDGTICYLEMSLFCIQSDKEGIFGITNVTKDITNLKYLESSLFFAENTKELLFENFTTALICIKRDGIIISSNKAAVTLFKYSPLQKKSLYSFFENRDDLKEELESLFDEFVSVQKADKSFMKIPKSYRLTGTENSLQMEAYVMHDTILDKSQMVISLSKSYS